MRKEDDERLIQKYDELYNEENSLYLMENWRDRIPVVLKWKPELADRVDEITNEELWEIIEAHYRLEFKYIAFEMRCRLKSHLLHLSYFGGYDGKE